MHTDAKKKSFVRVAGRDIANTKTTVSMSAAMRARFVVDFRSEKAFRKALNNMLGYAELATDSRSLPSSA